MLQTSHSLIGASLAKLVPNPYLGLPLAVISHFLADIFPHWDLSTRKNSHQAKTGLILKSLTDACLGLIVGWVLFRSQVNPTYLISMMFFSQLPDWIEAPYLIFNWQCFPFYSMKKLQSRLHWKLDWPWGFIIQFLIVFCLVVYALET